MIKNLMERYPHLKTCEEDIIAARGLLIDCFEKGGKLLLCGNGGSCADCDHIVGELMKGFLKKRPMTAAQKKAMLEGCPELTEDTLEKLQLALPAISLPSATALGTAFCNDVDPDLVYAQGVMGLGKRGDVLIAISTSGNSKNVTEAAKVARALGLKTIALTGRGGGKLKALCDVTVAVNECETYKVQELHLPVYHYLCAEIEEYFFN